MLVPTSTFAASHREAPITALDRTADITDWYAFVSFNRPDAVTMILNVDPLLEPSNGPNFFPFDPNVLYEMKIDNDQDGVEDVVFQFRFQTEYRAPGVFTAAVGGIAGIPPITSLDGDGSEGLNLRQTYSVTMVKNGVPTDLTGGRKLFAVPTNVGSRTMPNYSALYNQGQYALGNGVRVFAATINDPFFIDLGAAFDSLHFRQKSGGGVLSAAQDADDTHNYAPDAVAGYNVNSIVLEVPITMLTVDGKRHSAGQKQAVIGTYGTTSRAAVTVRNSPEPISTHGEFQQVQRMGNPLINELIIGTGSKDRFSMDDPKNDSQFADFFLDPLLAKIFGSIGIPVPPAPRTDLLPLVIYKAPICPGCGPNDAGPIADLLRLTQVFRRHLLHSRSVSECWQGTSVAFRTVDGQSTTLRILLLVRLAAFLWTPSSSARESVMESTPMATQAPSVRASRMSEWRSAVAIANTSVPASRVAPATPMASVQ